MLHLADSITIFPLMEQASFKGKPTHKYSVDFCTLWLFHMLSHNLFTFLSRLSRDELRHQRLEPFFKLYQTYFLSKATKRKTLHSLCHLTPLSPGTLKLDTVKQGEEF